MKKNRKKIEKKVTFSQLDTYLATIGVEIYHTGALIPNSITKTECIEVIKKLIESESFIQFAIGDFLQYYEKTWGDGYEELMAATGLSYGTICNYKSIAKKVPLSNRNEKLSFSHHAEVASLDEEEQKEMLDIAEKDNLNREDLRLKIKEKKSPNAKDPEITKHVCPFCGKRW